MPAPYSKDLRWKVVNAYQNDEGNQQAVAHRFSVSLSFVKRLWKRYQTYHDVDRRGLAAGSARRLMSKAKPICVNGLRKKGI